MAIPVSKPMDLAQATQRIIWLDEERRKDHAELARVAQELNGLLAVIKDQAVKLRETNDRLSAAEQTLTRIPHLEDAISLARSELIPLRETDIRLQDEIHRQDKDRQAHADQVARLWSEVNGRLEALTRHVDGLSNRLQTLETQRQEQATRLTELGTRLDTLAKQMDGLANRLKTLDVQKQEQAAKLSELEIRLDSLTKTANELASRLQFLETRENESVSRHAALQAQVSRLEASQGQVMEEVKRSVARMENLVADMQQVRREIIAAQEEEAKRRKEDLAAMIEQKEAIASAQRQVEDVIEAFRSATARLDRLEESATMTTETAHRLASAEEQLSVLQATYKGLQEMLDRYGGTEIPRILHMAEEAYVGSQNNQSIIQELVAGQQALKEELRQLQGSLAEEHTYSDELAAALRGLIEEDAQARLAAAQKQLQHLRRLANSSVSKKTDHA